MSYCKKYNMHPSVALCLACEECYPPAERVNGRMCGYEVELDTLSAQSAVKGMKVQPYMKMNTDREIVLTKEQQERLAKIINNDTGTGK